MWKRGDTSFVRSLLAPTGKGVEIEDFDDGDESEFLATVDKLLAEVKADMKHKDGVKANGHALPGSTQA
jgi:hypothetical protein